MPKTTYPTEWTGGIPRGGLSDRKTYCNLNFSSVPVIKGIEAKKNFSFSYANFNSKEECMEYAEKEKIRISHEYGLTRNEYRYLDKDTIEVQLTQDKTFVTNACNVNIVNKYPLQAKKKKDKIKGEKSIERFYVVGQDKKKTFQITDLLNDYKIVEYIDGNTLNLRKANMKEFGLAMVVKTNDQPIRPQENLIDDKAADYFKQITDLPKGEWILGTIPGTVFCRASEQDKVITMRITDNEGTVKSKTFKVDNYDGIDEAWLAVKTYLINVAHAMGVVKNKLRLSDKMLEISLGDNHIMKTDIEFLSLFIPSKKTLQPGITVCTTVGGGGSTRVYAAVYFKNAPHLANDIMYFHKFIMGAPMIDHINGDPLDNRLHNLRYTYHAHNATNRLDGPNGEVFGVKTGVISGVEVFTANIKDRGQQYFKSFPVSVHGPAAKSLAIRFRKHVMEIIPFCNLDGFTFVKNDIPTLKNTLKRTNELLVFTNNQIIGDPNEYLKEVRQMSPTLRTKLWQFYFDHQMLYLDGLLVTKQNLTNVLIDLKTQSKVEIPYEIRPLIKTKSKTKLKQSEIEV